MATVKPLTCQTYPVDVACPRCGQVETVLIALHAVLSVPDDDTPSLKVRLKAKAATHDCTQTRITVSSIRAGLLDLDDE